MPRMRPRRPLRSPITSPAFSAGATTSTFMIGSRSHGRDPEPDVAVLPAPARLLLVLALHLRPPLDRLLVRDARREQGDVHVVLALHPLDDDLDVELADARHQELLGLRVVVVAQRRVLLLHAVQRRRDLVLVA